MKNAQYLVNLARSLCGANISNYTDTDAIIDLNNIRHDIHGRVTRQGHDKLFWDEATWNLEDGRSEYEFPELDFERTGANQYFSGFSQILKVYIKRKDEDENYIELGQRSMDHTLRDLVNAPLGYAILDTGIFILPTPDRDVWKGVKVQGINKLRECDINSSEEKIFGTRIDPRFYEAVAIGMARKHVFFKKRDYGEAQALEMEYEKELKKIIDDLRSRSPRVIEIDPIPELFHFQ